MSVTGADIKKIKEISEEFLQKLGVNLTADVSADVNGIKISLTGKDSAILIGYHGETLSDLAYLLGTVVRRKIEKDERVRVDISGYLEAKDKKIKEMTMKTIDKVRHSGFPEEMSGLNAYERRIAHMVAEKEGYISESTGYSKERKIVIKPRKVTEYED